MVIEVIYTYHCAEQDAFMHFLEQIYVYIVRGVELQFVNQTKLINESLRHDSYMKNIINTVLCCSRSRSDTIKNMESRQLYRLQEDGVSTLFFMIGESR